MTLRENRGPHLIIMWAIFKKQVLVMYLSVLVFLELLEQMTTEWVAYSDRNLFCHCGAGQKSEIKMQAGGAPSGASGEDPSLSLPASGGSSLSLQNSFPS